MKWLTIVVALLGAMREAHSSRQHMEVNTMVCQPRTTFKLECNTCFCAPDGRNFGCTKMACLDRDDLPDQYYENNEPSQQNNLYRKRDTKSVSSRKKRSVDNIYDDDQQSFLDENPAPLSYEQKQQLAQQSYLQQQQSYYDQLQLQQDLEQEKADLEQQQEEMQSQLEYQQEQDAQQWEEDARQLALERQQQLIEQQQRQLELQGQQKQDEQYYRNLRKYSRKSPLRNVYPQ